MFGWIAHLFTSAAGKVDNAVRDFATALVRGLYGFVHLIFGNVVRAWNRYWTAQHMLWIGVVSLSRNVYQALIKIFRHYIPWLAGYIRWVYNQVIHTLYEWVRKLTALILHYYHVADTFIRWLWQWVIDHVYKPLAASLSAVWHWLTHEGATMWHYFTHLGDFAELLFRHLLASLERHAWDAGRLLGRFFLALIVRNMMTFVTLIEDIVHAVL